MSQLPALPDSRTPVSLASLEKIEQRVETQLPKVDDIDVLREWQAQAAALSTYLTDRVLRGPMLGAQRRVEARIGELIHAREQGRRSDLQPRSHVNEVISNSRERTEFRVLASALNGTVKLRPEEWRTSRRALVALVREQLPAPLRASVESRDVAARRKLREEFAAGLRDLGAAARWLEGRVERTAGIASVGEVDRWLVRVAQAEEHLSAVRAVLMDQEVEHGTR